MPGTLYGVGLGPGDPELVTVKAARLIRAADVIAYHSARHGRSVARAIAEPTTTGQDAGRNAPPQLSVFRIATVSSGSGRIV